MEGLVLLGPSRTGLLHRGSCAVSLRCPHIWPTPPFASSCLIAMALKNSKTGSLPVSEIYSFMKEHFPYFKVRGPSPWLGCWSCSGLSLALPEPRPN